MYDISDRLVIRLPICQKSKRIHMLIKRVITDRLLSAAQEYPVVSIVGPRQSGKTTLAQTCFPDHRYISLEDYDIRLLANVDPRKFLTDFPSLSGIILDEIQHAPQLLSYIQTIVDREKKNGFFIVTGSQNLLVDQAITQTLAGRMAVLTLLPLSLAELSDAGMITETIETLIYKGSYPQAHAQKVSIERLYSNYLRLYVERDVRQIKNVTDLAIFQKFMRLCAGRVGQILNLTSLGNDCGINHHTAQAWISLLEASYVIFLLNPYFNNFSKRLIKSPKLYFIDTGIICSLLKIGSAQELLSHYLRGGLIESFIIADFLKQQHNLEQQPSLYFWRDQTGNELDCVIDKSPYAVPIEIKGSNTIATDFFKGLQYWKKLTENTSTPGYVVYCGDENQSWPQAKVLSWKSIGNFIQDIST